MKDFEIRYFWKYITEDGLLKEPRFNDYYHSSLNEGSNDGLCGFPTEESAVCAFLKVNETNPYAFNSLVLLKEFRLV